MGKKHEKRMLREKLLRCQICLDIISKHFEDDEKKGYSALLNKEEFENALKLTGVEKKDIEVIQIKEQEDEGELVQ